MESRDITSEICKKYEDGRAYKNNLQLPRKWNTYNKFR